MDKQQKKHSAFQCLRKQLPSGDMNVSCEKQLPEARSAATEVTSYDAVVSVNEDSKSETEIGPGETPAFISAMASNSFIPSEDDTVRENERDLDIPVITGDSAVEIQKGPVESPESIPGSPDLRTTTVRQVTMVMQVAKVI